MRTEQKKLSKQQKYILKRITGKECLPVSYLYNSGTDNRRSVQASASRAISRLQDRGLVERVSIPGPSGRHVPGVRLVKS